LVSPQVKVNLMIDLKVASADFLLFVIQLLVFFGFS